MARLLLLLLLLGLADASFHALPLPPAAAPASPYYLLKPSAFAAPLGEDAAWAATNIPLFECANSTLELAYYFRWRTYRSHIHATNRTDNMPWVVTEFR